MKRKITTDALRIVIVDDYSVVRSGLRRLTEGAPDLEVCCECSDPATAIECARAGSPDVAVVDLSLDGRSGLDLVTQLTSELPDLRVLALSMHDELLYAQRALKAGAHGYIMRRRRSWRG